MSLPAPLIPFPTTAAERYDRSLHRSLALHPVTGVAVPKPTSHWPQENTDFLEQYRHWLVSACSATSVINQHRIPMAGHVLGLFLQPHHELDLEVDFAPALAFVKVRKPSRSWLSNSRHSLNWFGRFIRVQRGVSSVISVPYGNVDRFKEGLPDWLLTLLTQYQHIRQVHWRTERMNMSIYQFWHKHVKPWHWLFANTEVTCIEEIKRKHVFAFMDALLQEGYKASSINMELYNFQSVLRFAQQLDWQIPHGLLAIKGLKQPDALPRNLTDTQIGLVRDRLFSRIEAAKTSTQQRDRAMDLAMFYLLWQGGLRLGELEMLELTDLDFPAQRLTVRRGKGQKDRTVYLTEAVVKVLEAFMAVRILPDSARLFMYRYRPLSKDFVRSRLKAVGKEVGVHITPHMLRHTFATQLLNAGCKITTIQKLLGHERLQTTLVYARVHDQTVADDYFRAMSQIEGALDLPNAVPDPAETPSLVAVSALLSEVLSSELGEVHRVKLMQIQMLL